MAKYEAVIGVEVHVELHTRTKLFCGCSTTFGAPPNTQCCPVCMGLPGALPTWNGTAIALAAKAGLALQAEVQAWSLAERKQYFYPDLPKGYQISQGAFPICRGGSLTFLSQGEKHVVEIERIHLEEDAGKLIHQASQTLFDGNRCGIPLIEIVSKPQLHSGKEAAAYLRTLRTVLLACGISDCKMQEGSFRCDVNVSIRPVGSQTLGVRTEIKNLNSFAYAERAIAYEIERQTALLESGASVLPETRRFDEARGETVLMRRKERAEDYRLIVEPNLPPICISPALLEQWRTELPELPQARQARMMEQYQIPLCECEVLMFDMALADYFEEAATQSSAPVLLLHLILTELLRLCREEPFAAPVRACRMAELSNLLAEGRINHATAKKLIVRLAEADDSPSEMVEREGLWQICDKALLMSWIDEILVQAPKAVADYRAGKRAAMNPLLGRLMARSQGRAEPRLAEELFRMRLDEKENGSQALEE